MESGTISAVAGGAVDAPTMAEAFRRTAAAHPDVVAFRTLDDSVSITWGQARERVDAIARGLASIGVRRGDTVALMLSNRPEFHLIDLAVMSLGATPFSIYQTYPAEEIEYLLADAGTRVILTEDAFLEVVQAACARLDAGVEHVINLDGAGEGVLALAELEQGDASFDVDAAIAAIEPDDVLTLIYTSGTTGPPKGVQLSHRNLLALVAHVQDLVELPPGARVISWLPAAHIAERAAHHYLPMVFACTVTTCPNAREVMSYLPQVRPNWFFAVPRIWEKLKAGLETMLAGQDEATQARMNGVLSAAIEKVRLEQRGEPVSAELAEQVAKADAEMFGGLRTMLGLDQVVTVNVGAAPTPVEVLEFFHAIGIELAELYGLSETCGGGTVNPPGKVRIGTVGTAMPGIEVTLADDGEVLMRGDVVMLGYRNNPEQTAAAIDPEGWLHTGDIGKLDDEGYLRIVDRKKEIIINAAGKNMSPTNIEAALKTASPLIGIACAIGDGRPYNTALLVLDADFAPAWAAKQEIEDTSLEALAGDERMRAEIDAAVKAGNAKLARVEQIKKFTIVEGDWAPGGDELTPTMKLKRKPIAAKYAAAIDSMYS